MSAPQHNDFTTTCLVYEEETKVPADQVVLVKDAHQFIGNVGPPFSDPSYEWEVPIVNLTEIMSQQLPMLGTQFDGHSIDSIIRSVKGRAILSGLIQTRLLRLDYPAFVDGAHIALEAHQSHLKQLHAKMQKVKQAEAKAAHKREKAIDQVLIKQAKQEQKELSKAQREKSKQERANVKALTQQQRAAEKEERARLRSVAQAEKRFAQHMKRRNKKSPEKSKREDSDSDSSDSDNMAPPQLYRS